MRSLVKQYLDSDLSRRSMMRQLALWGVSLASAEALLDSLGVARAQEGPPSENDQTTVDGEGKEVTGNGADLLMETLIAAGVKYVFHGSGGGSNRFFDAIVVRPELKNFLGTNEGQSVAMADGYHLATGELGLAIIPKPGLFNAASNIHNALAHRSSLFVLTARENNKWSERRGNIEVIDWEKSMDPMMKWSYRMHQLDRVPEFASRAIKVANTPLGGPVFLQMDEDLYESETTAVIPPQDHFRVNANVRPDPDRIIEAARMLIEAEAPLIGVGLEITKAGAQQEIIELAELLGVPVTQNLSVHVDFPNQHPLFLGAYNRFLGYTREADLFMLIGAQMPDIGHYIVTGPPPVNAKTVHISMEPELLANFYPTELSIMANAKAAVSDLIEAVKSLATKERIASIKAAREEKMLARIQDARERSILRGRTGWDEAPITFARLSTELDNALEDDAIVVSEPLFGVPQWFDLGLGKKTMYGPQPGEILGWATASALGVKLAKPDKQVVAISGDGALMFQNNLWALSRYDAPILTVIYNNRCYNLNRAAAFGGGGRQAKLGKDIVTYLGNPDVNFADYARAFKIDAEVVEDPAELAGAIQRGLNATKEGKPYLLDVVVKKWGPQPEDTYHPDWSIAEMRTRKI